jgi:hypothetical protein
MGDMSKGEYVEIGPNGIIIHNDGTQLKIWADLDGNVAQSEIRINGIDATDPDAHLGLIAKKYDGSGEVSLILDTYTDLATLDAEQFLIGESITLTAVTTTERNALNATNGMIVYNSTTSKFQGYAGGSWVDLH